MPGKTPTLERELPPQHTAPPWDHGAGAYHPHVERPPWLDDQAFDAEVDGSILPQGVPPMPWPFSYPDKLPRKPWVRLKDGQRLNLPLIRGFIGKTWLQAGYTISRECAVGIDDNARFHGAIERETKSMYLKSFFSKVGATLLPDGMSYWVTINLPKALSRGDSNLLQSGARPIVTVSLKPRGWNSILTLRYEDIYWVEVPDEGKVQLSSGVYVDISIMRVLVTGVALYGAYRLVALTNLPNPLLQPELELK